MEFSLELYKNEDEEKMVYIAANNTGASGAKYRYETAEDIGKAVHQYISLYYNDEI